MQTDYMDISFTVKESELMGRRLLRDLKTGQIYYDPMEPDAAAQNLPVPDPMEPVEPLPEASVEQPSADPVDLLSLREKQLDEAFKPLGAKIDAKVLAPPTKSVAKRKKVQHGA